MLATCHLRKMQFALPKRLLSRKYTAQNSQEPYYIHRIVQIPFGLFGSRGEAVDSLDTSSSDFCYKLLRLRIDVLKIADRNASRALS